MRISDWSSDVCSSDLTAFHESITQNRPLSFALLDIDNFKRINDSYSHQAGDNALKAVAAALRGVLAECTAETDTPGHVARWGGEEFALLLPGIELDVGRQVAERVRAAVEAIDCRDFAPGLSMTGSVGVTDSGACQNNERMVSRADQRLYEAKAAGRNKVMG